ncbi:MAG: hypothetical protein AAFN77_15840 [Planctomycetota bacterium]
MNLDKHNQPSRNSPGATIDWKKGILIGILIIVAAYQYFKSDDNQQDANGGGQAVVNDGSIDIPKTIDLKLDSNSTAKRQGNSQKDASVESTESEEPYLSNGKNGSKVSPAGLIYTSSRSGEHRTDHVLRHARDIPDRSGSHGVFEVETDDDVFRLIDEAYELINEESDRVRGEKEQNGRRAFVIDMQRTIGYRGGQSGKRAGYPKLKKVKLVLAEDRVITAYPY